MVRFQSPAERNFDLNLIPEEGDEEIENNHLAMQVQSQFPSFQKACGFRFNPTDVEIILGYLQPFTDGERLPENKIHYENVYLYHPDELSARFEKSNDKEIFFIRNGSTDRGRTAIGGFWHSTTGRKDVLLGNRIIGQKQNFNFFNGGLLSGKPPKDGKTTWLMVEYTLVDANKSTKTSASASASAELTMDVDSNIKIKSNTNVKEPEMDVDSNIKIKSNTNVKEPKMKFVLSKMYKSVHLENKTEDYANVIKQYQQLAIRDEELWQKVQFSG